MLNLIKRGWQRLRHFEPARLQATWIALAGAATTLGVGQEYAHADVKVQGALTALAVILPLLQGEVTRAKVYAPGNVEVAHTHDDEPGQVIGDDAPDNAELIS